MSLGTHYRVRGTTPYYNAIRRLAFPSLTTIAAYLVVLTIGVTAFAFFLLSPTLDALFAGAQAGLVLFALPTFAVDLLINRRLMRGDELFYLRRVLALSLFSVAVWGIGLLIGVPVKFALGDVLRYPEHMLFVATFVVVTFRMIAALSMSNRKLSRRLAFALSQPAAVLAAGTLLWQIPWTRSSTVLAASSLFGLTFCALLLRHVEKQGMRQIGSSPLKLFRSFLQAWLNGETGPLEQYLRQLGEESEVGFTTIGFKESEGNKWKGIVISPDIHPGPFLNIGSSALPFLIQSTIQRHAGCPTLVTHGVSGHELNLVSQNDNLKVLDEILRSLKSSESEAGATRLIRHEVGPAKATCQVFGKTALVTMTAAPMDMEDIPLETGIALRKELNGLFANVALVDAHNSLSGPTSMDKVLVGNLTEAARMAAKEVTQIRKSHFRIGFAHARPEAWGLRDGLGPAGVTVCITEIDGTLNAYLSYDGNNMAPGLRQRLLQGLKETGIEDGEILTTDTHVVNGVTRAKLGYRLVGETSPDDLIKLSIDLVKQARDDLSPVRVATSTGSVHVRTLGRASFKRITKLMHEISQLTAITLFPTVILVALLTLVVLV